MRFSLKTTSDKQPNHKYTPPATVQNHIADPGKMVPKTNADRIRAMDDELLATQFVQVVRETIEVLTKLEMPDSLLNEIRTQILEKLKEPAEGE